MYIKDDLDCVQLIKNKSSEFVLTKKYNVTCTR